MDRPLPAPVPDRPSGIVPTDGMSRTAMPSLTRPCQPEPQPVKA
jgi:hypothetical protein